MIVIDILDVLSGSALGCVSTEAAMDWGVKFEATGIGYSFGGKFLIDSGPITWEEWKCDHGSIGDPCDPSQT